jgi:capsular exopolysaccharide synthesis family protein
MEQIDIKVLIKKVIRKWYWFILSMAIAGTAGVYYLVTTQKEYLVEASIKLKDEIEGRNYPKKDFLQGHELLQVDSKLDDEIGILTSYNLIKKSLEKLDFEVSYFHYTAKLGRAGKVLAKELYPAPFKVVMKRSNWQLTGVPIFIEFLEGDKYRVSLSAKKTPLSLYQPVTQDIKTTRDELELDTILHVSESLETPFLSISLTDVKGEVWAGERNYIIYIYSVADLAEDFKTRLKNAPYAEKSDIVQLSIEGNVPQKSIEFLNMLSQTYVHNYIQRKKKAGEKTIEFIDIQLEGLTDSIKHVQDILKSFRSQNHIMDVNITAQNLNEQLYNLEEKHANLKVQNEYFKFIMDYLEEHDDVDEIISPSSVGIIDAHLSSLLSQLSALHSERISRGFSSNDNSPVVQVINKKIESTKKAIKDNVSSLHGSNEMAMKENNRRIGRIKDRINRLPENEMDLNNIERRFTFNNHIYNYLLQKRADAGIAIASNITDITLIDDPRQIGKGPVAPNSMMVLMLSFVLGFGLPLGLVMVAEVFHSKLDREDQLLKYTAIPVVKTIMQLKNNENKYAFSEKDYLSHAFRYIRLHLDFLQEKEKVKIVGVTSPVSGEGKTFCALNIALTCAAAGKKTLLIDADLHNPDLGKLLESKMEGKQEKLVDRPEAIISKAQYNDLNFLSVNKPDKTKAGNGALARLHEFIESIKEEYDIIIIDTPPIGVVGDFLQLSKSIDYSFVVVRQDFTEVGDVKSLDSLFSQYGIKAGIIYNGANSNKKYKKYFK